MLRWIGEMMARTDDNELSPDFSRHDESLDLDYAVGKWKRKTRDGQTSREQGKRRITK